jgi:putative membrane protein
MSVQRRFGNNNGIYPWVAVGGVIAVIAIIVIVAIATSASAASSSAGPFWYYGAPVASFPFGFFWLWPVLGFFFIFFVVRWFFWGWGWGGGWGGGWRNRSYYYNNYHSDAESILEARYARGEITKEQFEQMKRDIRQD